MGELNVEVGDRLAKRLCVVCLSGRIAEVAPMAVDLGVMADGRDVEDHLVWIWIWIWIMADLDHLVFVGLVVNVGIGECEYVVDVSGAFQV